MNAEIMHDALNLLPGDLITAVDRVRSGARRKLPLRRWLSAAACLAVLLWSGWFLTRLGTGGKTESVAEAPAAAAPMEQSSLSDAADMELILLTPTEALAEEKAQSPDGESAAGAGYSAAYYCTPVIAEPSSGTTAAVLIRSAEELEAYFREQGDAYSLEEMRREWETAGEDWFVRQELLVLRLETESSEPRYRVTDLTPQKNCDPPAWEITLEETAPEDGLKTGAGICWHILLTVEKGMLEKDHVILVNTRKIQ